jgi:inosine-uridine nucleoside N-ribohydrolase
MSDAAQPGSILLIDSDGGVDDALAIALAAEWVDPSDIILTSVFGNVPVAQATRNLSLIASRTGKAGAVVWRGAASASDGFTIDATQVHGTDGLGGATASFPAQQINTAPLDALLAQLRGPSETRKFRLLGIGPATNMPRLIEAIGPANIEGVTLMSGSVFDRGNITQWAEFNLYSDPAAFNEVIASGAQVTMVPLDLCRKVVFERRNLPHLKKLGSVADILAPAHEFYMARYAGRDGIDGCFPHDSIALLASLFPARFVTVGMDAEACIDGDQRGRLIVKGLNPHSRLRVCLGGDLKPVRELFNTSIPARDFLKQFAERA